MMHWGNFSGMGFGDFGFSWIFTVVFWALVILGVIYLIKYITGSDRKESQRETALDILKKRYARGEINKEEFEEKKKDLSS
jgi:putative membrane protein